MAGVALNITQSHAKPKSKITPSKRRRRLLIALVVSGCMGLVNYPTLMALAFLVQASNFNALRDR